MYKIRESQGFMSYMTFVLIKFHNKLKFTNYRFILSHLYFELPY